MFDRKKWMKEYRLRNRKKLYQCRKEWISRNKDHFLSKTKAYRLKYNEINRDKQREYFRKYRKDNIERCRRNSRIGAKRRRSINPDKYKEYRRKYYASNSKKENQRKRIWAKKHPDKVKLWKREESRRRRSDPIKRLICNMRTRLSNALKSNRKQRKTIEFLGCSINDLKIYLESKFETGMSWENYGRKGWSIDHIMPCAIFDLTKLEHQRRCFHFSNLQPMWESDNCRKRHIVTTGQFNLL